MNAHCNAFSEAVAAFASMENTALTLLDETALARAQAVLRMGVQASASPLTSLNGKTEEAPTCLLIVALIVSNLVQGLSIRRCSSELQCRNLNDEYPGRATYVESLDAFDQQCFQSV